MTNVLGGTIFVRIEGQDVNLTTTLQRLNKELNTSGQNIRGWSTTMQEVPAKTNATQTAFTNYQLQLARLAEKSGQAGEAQRILAAAISQVTPDTQNAVRLHTALQDALNREEAAAKKAGTGYTQLASSLQVLIGGYYALSQVVSVVGKAISAGNELEKQEGTFRALSGSEEAYQKNLAQAREEQSKFGGSLKDTLEGMSGFVVLSRNTGVELSRLTRLAREMAIIDPAQG